MYYDKIKYKRQTKIPEKNFYDYTLEQVPISKLNIKIQYPLNTMAIIGTERKTQKDKIQSILIPRSLNEIKEKVKNGDIYLKIATLEKEDFETSDIVINFEYRDSIKIKYDPYLPNEARAEPYKNIIYVGNKYFEIPIKGRDHILRHEVGHFWESEITCEPDLFWKLGESKIFGQGKENNGRFYFEGIFGTYNLSEAMAESFSYYIGSVEEKKFFKNKHFNAYNYVKKNSKYYKAIQ